MLYAIRLGDDGPIKIGRAKNPKSRIGGLQVACPYPLRLLAECDWHDSNELIIHHHLRHSYMRGEWFEPTEDVLAVVSYMRGDDFDGLAGVIGPLNAMPRFDKKAYQREYMKAWRLKQKS